MIQFGERSVVFSETTPAVPKDGRRRFSASAFILPVVTSLILLIPTLFYWAHERTVSAEFLQSRAAQYRLRLAKRIQTEIDSQLRPLRRLANEVASRDVASAENFTSSARSICREEPTLKYIAWIGRGGQCFSAYPTDAQSKAAAGLYGSDNSARDQLFESLAKSPDGMLVSFPANSVHASDRLIVLPIMGGVDSETTSHAVQMAQNNGGAVAGAIVTCEPSEALLGTLIPPDASAPFIVEVNDERGQPIFSSEGATSPEALRLLRNSDVDQIAVLDQSWSMSVAAAPPGLGRRPASDTDAFLLSGVIVALLGGATVAQATRHRRRERQKADDHLATLEDLLEQQQRLNLQVRKDADAKAMLLRELNHRVKNNLAGIVGLLSAGVPELSEHAQRWLDGAIARIETLARAHELFVGTSSELGLADLLSKTLEPIWAIKPADVRITMDLASVNDPLSTDQAVTLAMVVHELASNALQHGVGNRGSLCIRSRRTESGWAMIEVIDDGAGREDNEKMVEAAGGVEHISAVATLTAPAIHEGIGLQLVSGLVGRELHGTFSLSDNAAGGKTATVEFPIGVKAPQTIG